MGAIPDAEASYSKNITSKVFVTLNTSGWAPGYWIWGYLDQVPEHFRVWNFLHVFLLKFWQRLFLFFGGGLFFFQNQR